MYCKNCGAEVNGGNFCSYCGQPLTEITPSISLMNKAVSTANSDNQYSLVLVSCGTCSKVMTGDLLEDVFGYTDAESTNLVNMAPVVVGERLNAREAQTVAQLLTEYGVQVSITNQQDQYVDLTANATSSVFDKAGNLLSGAAAIIGALTVSNRIRSYQQRRSVRPHQRIWHGQDELCHAKDAVKSTIYSSSKGLTSISVFFVRAKLRKALLQKKRPDGRFCCPAV